MKTLLMLLGGIVATLGIVAGSALWQGYVLSVLWAWFAVPLFRLPVLSIPAAMGVSLLVGMLTHQSQHELAKKSKTGSDLSQLAQSLCWVIVYPAAGLLIGWIVKGYL